MATGKKRLNPETNKAFEVGDVRKDGYIFMQYRIDHVKKDGFFSERWVSKKRWDEYKEYDSSRAKRKHKEGIKNRGKKSINPDTGTFYKMGDRRKDGKVFLTHQTYVKDDGFRKQQWVDYDSYHRYKIKNLMTKVRSRSKKQGVESDLTREYLEAIFPKDGLCPVLNMKMDWGGERKGSRTSPSLDKIEPSLGYVKDNVMWMSQRANSMKQDSSSEELKSFAKWIKKTIK